MDTDFPADDQSKMLDLLDHAYEVSEDIDNFDHMIEAARAYFFVTPDSSTLSPNLPRYAGLNPHLEQHIPRLEKMMQDAPADAATGLSLEQHARLTLSSKGQIIKINTHAETLFGAPGSRYVDDLPLSHESLTTLKALLTTLRDSAAPLQRVIYVQTNHDTPVSTFAYCRSANGEDGGRTLNLNLSQFEWSPALFEHLETALGLTQSEGQILRGTLMGLSQKDMAQERDRSVDTIKSQAKSVLRKAGCAKMGDLLHLSTSIAYVISLSESMGSDNALPDTRYDEEWSVPTENMSSVSLKDSRVLTYYEYGPISGRPVLFIHGFVQGPFFTRKMLQTLNEHNLRIIAPCRPGFGYCSPSPTRGDFDQTVIDDTQFLLGHLGVTEPLLLAAHQGGVSHAFRIAKRLENQISSMLMIGAGIPITPEHIKILEPQTQLAAVATRHAPSIMKMTMSMGLKAYKKRGAEAFLKQQFLKAPDDLKTLQNAELLQIQKWGCYFMTQQGVETFMRDGLAAMADWSEDFDAAGAVQHWIHGKDCPVMGAEFVKDYIGSKTNYPVDIIEKAGFNVLHTEYALIAQTMAGTFQ
ncbi:MAG: alpha/beta fold hydrolase [Alphaproteobacteria bacterium]